MDKGLMDIKTEAIEIRDASVRRTDLIIQDLNLYCNAAYNIPNL